MSLTEFLDWGDKGLTRLEGGSSSLLNGIEVYIDFIWQDVFHQYRRTFTRYSYLVNYVWAHSGEGRMRSLVLTTQPTKREGRRTDHPTHDIFVVNIDRYRIASNSDFASGYFSGLLGAPIINPETITAEEIAELLDSIGSPDAISEWIKRHSSQAPILFSKLKSIPLEGAETGKLIEQLKARLDTLTSEDLAHLRELLLSEDFPKNLVSAAELARRKASVDEFNSELEKNQWKEEDWQKFFKRERWIFGHGLLYQFLEVIGEKVYVGGKDMTNSGGQVSDFAHKTSAAAASFIDLVDIKTPGAQLIGEHYRNHAYSIHQDLAGPVAQIESMCDRWLREGSSQPENVVKAYKEKWQTAQPRGILVVGHTKSLEADGTEEEQSDKKQSFHLFRRSLHCVEILTFDELLARADAIASPESDDCVPEESNDAADGPASG